MILLSMIGIATGFAMMVGSAGTENPLAFMGWTASTFWAFNCLFNELEKSEQNQKL